MKNQIYRQGDVLIQRVASIPADAQKRADGILAHGEVTGHHHSIAVLEDATLFTCGDEMFLNVGPRGVSISHQEHAPIALPPGSYEVIRQSEYTPGEIRSVQD